jgi:hypothetical protein
MIVNSFLGIRNTESSRSIPENALSDAVNVDISDAGVITQKNGFTSSLDIATTTAYSTLDNTGYVVSSGVLYQVLNDLTVINIAPCMATEFSDYGKVLYTQDGLKVESGIATTIKIPVPEYAPSMRVIDGTMPAGTYSAVQCFRAASRLEGGSSEHSSIELTSEGGIAIDPIDVPAGYTVNVYLTDANGSVYYDSNGIQINQYQLLAESFPDDIDKICYHNSRLYLSKALPDGNTVVWFSHPFMPHLYDMESNYFIVQGEVRAMMSEVSALIIATDSAIYAYADGLNKLADYGVPTGRSIVRKQGGNVVIWTNRGVCQALPFQNLTETKSSFAPGIQCSTAIVEQDGIVKFVALSSGDGTPYSAVT